MTRQKATASLKFLAPALLVFVTLACSPPEQNVERVEDLDQILAAVPDESMRALWQEAAAKGTLPDLALLPVPANPLEQRTRVVETGQPGPARPPVIPKDAPATVEPFSSEPLHRYEGAYRIADTRPGLLVGSLVDGPERFELHYKLPGDAELRLPDSKELQLTYEDGLELRSQRRLVRLWHQSDPTLLLYLSDGGPEPYRRVFEKLGLQVRQGDPDKESLSVAPVIVSSRSGDEVALLPGETGRLRDGKDELEVFVQSSFYSTSPGARLLEGDAFHVILLVYRPK